MDTEIKEGTVQKHEGMFAGHVIRMDLGRMIERI